MSAIDWVVQEATKPAVKWVPMEDPNDEGRQLQANRIVRALRKTGRAMTRQELANDTGWSTTKVADVVRFGVRLDLFVVYTPPKIRTGPFQAHRVMLK